MAERIVGMIREFGGGVTFAQLDRIDGFGGTLGLMLDGPRMSNVCLWPALSREAIDAITELRASQAVEVKSTSILTYLLDGRTPGMPIAKRARHYKTERWLPVVFWLPSQLERQRTS